jgi:hypothetical protein
VHIGCNTISQLLLSQILDDDSVEQVSTIIPVDLEMEIQYIMTWKFLRIS